MISLTQDDILDMIYYRSVFLGLFPSIKAALQWYASKGVTIPVLLPVEPGRHPVVAFRHGKKVVRLKMSCVEATSILSDDCYVILGKDGDFVSLSRVYPRRTQPST